MDAVRPLAAIFLVLALLAAARWALRRGGIPLPMPRGGRRRNQSLEVVERIPLTPQHSLHVIRTGAEEWILATHPQGCSVVHKTKSMGAAT